MNTDLPRPDSEDPAERLLAAIYNVYWCHDCYSWRRAISEDHGESFTCDTCGAIVPCDECGKPWSGKHSCK